MIQKLFLLLHIYLIIQKTRKQKYIVSQEFCYSRALVIVVSVADDPIVSKEESPAGIRCQRTKGQVAVEKQQANTN